MYPFIDIFCLFNDQAVNFHVIIVGFMSDLFTHATNNNDFQKRKKMKRLFILALALIGFGTAGFAQTAEKVKTNGTAKVHAAKKQADAKAEPAAAAASATTQNAATKLKKDGTPDKRYKANAAVAAGPVKKDGTPDKRFKANKKPK
jgi:hypothetical protein